MPADSNYTKEQSRQHNQEELITIGANPCSGPQESPKQTCPAILRGQQFNQQLVDPTLSQEALHRT